MHHLWASVVPLAGGLLLGFTVIGAGWWAALVPVSWLLTTHGLRKLRVMILHQCSHNNFLPHRTLDSYIGRFIALLVVSQEYAGYQREHVSDHHSVHHMTMRDPTVQFLIVGLGAHPGMTRRQLWRRLLVAVLLPRHHIQVTWARVASHLRGTPMGHRAALAAMLGGQLLVVGLNGAWPAYLVVWVFPLIVLFNASAAIRVCSRHTFPAPGVALRGRMAIAAHTHGIFLGDPVPAAGRPWRRLAVDWTRWWLRLVLVHLPARLLVMVGDTPCHDHHHRYPRSPGWANYFSAREDDIRRGHPHWPPYTEVWGLTEAINMVFDSLSVADPARYDPRAGEPARAREFLVVEE